MIWIILVVIMGIIFFAASSKGTKNNSAKLIDITEEAKNKMNALLEEMVSFGVQGLTSLQMSHDEKANIVNDAVTSIKENASDIEQERQLLLKMVKQAYNHILTELKYDDVILLKIRKECDEFVLSFENGVAESYPWDELIIWTDIYKPYLQRQLDAVELKMKQTRIITSGKGFAHLYINDDNTIKFEVSGVKYLNEDELAIVKTLRNFDSKVQLEQDPDNEHDADAILVKTMDGSKIGYVNKDALPVINLVLDRIIKCQISKLSDDVIPYVWVKVYYHGEYIGN